MTEENKVNEMSPEEIREAVQETYSRLLKGNKSEKVATSGCCGSQAQTSSSDSPQTI